MIKALPVICRRRGCGGAAAGMGCGVGLDGRGLVRTSVVTAQRDSEGRQEAEGRTSAHDHGHAHDQQGRWGKKKLSPFQKKWERFNTIYDDSVAREFPADDDETSCAN